MGKKRNEDTEVSKPKSEREPSSTVELTARVDLKMPNGRFYKKGEKVKVTKEYADRLRKEKDKRFI